MATRVKLHAYFKVFAIVFLIVFFSVFLGVFMLIPLYYGHLPSLVQGRVESGVAFLFLVVLFFSSCIIAGMSVILSKVYRAVTRRRERNRIDEEEDIVRF
jgi:hypothetical protein